MTYATGSASTANQLIDAIQSFAVANGWTLNYAGADGSNKRLHISKNGCYANFSSNYSPGSSLFGFNISSGFTGSGPGWYAQTSPVSTVTACPTTVNSFAILPCTYHLFSQDNPEFLAGVFVGANNTMTCFSTGNLEKIGTYTGGSFGYAGAVHTSFANTSGDTVLTGTGIYMKTPTGMPQAYQYGCSVGVDTLTGMSPLMPIRAYELTSGQYKPRGLFPWMRVCATAYLQGDEITYGADTWKVFYTDNTSPSMIAFKK